MDSSSANGFITNIGLTIQDWLQYAMPGFFVVIAIFVYVIKPFHYTTEEVFNIISNINIWTALCVLMASYCLGQLVASVTHIIDLVTKKILKNQSFGTPVNFSKISNSVRYEVCTLAYEKALRELHVNSGLSEASFNVIREYMLYIIMKKQYTVYADIRRYRSVVYFRKHMVLALFPYIVVAYHYQKYVFLIFILFLIGLYFWGYKTLYCRTFLDRIPLSYLVIVSSLSDSNQESGT